MARHYTTKDFFRQTLSALLAGYFTAQRLFGDLDFLIIKENKPDALFDAWRQRHQEGPLVRVLLLGLRGALDDKTQV